MGKYGRKGLGPGILKDKIISSFSKLQLPWLILDFGLHLFEDFGSIKGRSKKRNQSSLDTLFSKVLVLLVVGADNLFGMDYVAFYIMQLLISMLPQMLRGRENWSLHPVIQRRSTFQLTQMLSI